MKSVLIRFTVSFGILLALTAGVSAATLVPPGNRNAEQPAIPGGSIKRTRGSSFDKKYQKIRRLLAKDKKLRRQIIKAARTFNIDPIHIVGALVGEHTYNVDAKDRLQTYYVKALSYLGQDLTFKYKSTKITDLVKQPAFGGCANSRGDYALWSCRERIWNTQYRGKRVGGIRWPNKRLGVVFFQPLYAGQTFGLGQLNPLTALKLNDVVRRKVRREPKLYMNKAPQIYSTIMKPDSSLYYMAASIRHAIDSYKAIADVDISKNPGITATLYNLGNVTTRAKALKTKGGLPQENYYGWLVNEKLSDLRSLF